MTKTASRRNVSVLEFKANAEQAEPLPLGARLETTEGRVVPPQIEPIPAAAIDVIPDRAVIVQKLEAIVQFRLFGRGGWLADRETCHALERTLMELGLWERVPGAPDTWQNTALGKELSLDQYLVFAGLYDGVDIPIILEHHRLIDESTVDCLYTRLEAGADAETLLRGYVQHAYFIFHKAANRLS